MEAFPEVDGDGGFYVDGRAGEEFAIAPAPRIERRARHYSHRMNRGQGPGHTVGIIPELDLFFWSPVVVGRDVGADERGAWDAAHESARELLLRPTLRSDEGLVVAEGLETAEKHKVQIGEEAAFALQGAETIHVADDALIRYVISVDGCGEIC